MKKITLIYPYYKNPAMLRRHIEEWNTYSKSVVDSIEIIVTDDGSPKSFRAEDVLAGCDTLKNQIQIRLFRILTDLRWNISQARNLGARNADSEWLLFSDIDHLMPAETIEAALNFVSGPNRNSECVYRFNRVEYRDKSQCQKIHLETMLMTKRKYWEIGGHDESYSGHYSIADEEFRARMNKVAAHHTLSLDILKVGRGDIHDASTLPIIGRNDSREGNEREEIEAWKKQFRIGIELFKLPWKEIRL